MGFNSDTAAQAGAKSSRKGVPNKTTKVLRERVESFLEDNWESLLDDIATLTPKERVNTAIKLMEYALPKLNRVEIKEPSSDDLDQITIFQIPDNGRGDVKINGENRLN